MHRIARFIRRSGLIVLWSINIVLGVVVLGTRDEVPFQYPVGAAIILVLEYFVYHRFRAWRKRRRRQTLYLGRGCTLSRPLNRRSS